MTLIKFVNNFCDNLNFTDFLNMLNVDQF